jgi:ubiquitin-protein ligase E3 C
MRVTDPTNAAALPPLLFLADLYTQALHTMGDDEFFANASTTASISAPRNPLTLDELIGFSRQLLNIAFALYWREDQAGVLNENVQSDVIRMKWERVRDTVTRCLVAIHARESVFICIKRSSTS